MTTEIPETNDSTTAPNDVSAVEAICEILERDSRRYSGFRETEAIT